MKDKLTLAQEFLALFRDPVYVNINERGEYPPLHKLKLEEVMSVNEGGAWGAYFSVNGFANYASDSHRTKECVTSLNAHFIDVDGDGRTREEIRNDIQQLAAESGIPFTCTILTGKGVHAYWVFKEPIVNPTEEQVSLYLRNQAALVRMFKADESVKDIPRVLRIPGSKYWKDGSGREIVPGPITENRYDESEFSELFKSFAAEPQSGKADVPDLLLHGVPVGEGKRHHSLAQVAGVFLRGAKTPEDIAAARQNLYAWDRQIVKSPEAWESRKKEVDEAFGSILKREFGKRAPQKESSKPNLATMDWKQIDSIVFPADRWRVADLIPKAGAVILASVSGEGKTWIALEIARSISTGTPLFGQPQFAVEKARVLYIGAENGTMEIQRRGRMLGFGENENLSFVISDDLNLNNDAWCAELKQKISTENIKVIIVDTFRGVAGKIQEEKAEEIRAFFNLYTGLKEDGICMIWLDHFRKPDHFAGKIPKKEHLFGSQDKAASIDVLLMMRKEDEGIMMYQRKNRLGGEVKDFQINLKEEVVEGVKRMSLTYGGQIDEMESKKNLAKDYILLILVEGPKTTSEIKYALRNEKEIGERNMRDALKELLKDKAIGRRKKGRQDEYSLQKVDDHKPLPELY